MTARVFFTTYGLYNAGLQFADEKTGAWYDVDSTDYDEIIENLQAAQLALGLGDDVEPMATDYEGFPRNWYTESMGRADYEAIQEWSGLDEEEQAQVSAVIGQGCASNLDDALEYARDNYQGTYNDVEDYAYEYIEESGMLSTMPENLRGYFDYKAFARDLEMGDIWTADADGGQVMIFLSR